MATRRHTYIYTHASSNAVTLVWRSLRLAPINRATKRDWKRAKNLRANAGMTSRQILVSVRRRGPLTGIWSFISRAGLWNAVCNKNPKLTSRLVSTSLIIQKLTSRLVSASLIIQNHVSKTRKRQKSEKKKVHSLALTLSLTLSLNHLANELLRRTSPTVQSNTLYRHNIL